MERIVNKNLELCQELIQSAPIPMIVINEEELIVHANDEFVTLMPDEVLEPKPLYLRAINEIFDGLTIENSGIKKIQTIFLNSTKEQKNAYGAIVGDWLTSCSGSQFKVIVINSTSVDEPGDIIGQSKKGRLETIGLLFIGVIHDFNNLLTSILGHVGFLKIAPDTSAEIQSSVKAIELATKQASEICSRFLEFAKGEVESEEQSINLDELITECLNILTVGLPANIKVNYSCDCEARYIKGRHEQISQLFINLIVNAKEAIGKTDGKIDVFLYEDEISDDNNEYGLKLGQYLIISVCDNGCGMDDDIKRKIFEPLYSTKSGKGTGLGLSTARTVVAEHNGALTVESELGLGSLFEIYLPVISSPEQKEKIKIPKKRKDKYAVLVVDDEMTVRTVVVKSLEHLGYEVFEAENGFEAISQYEKHQDECDIVLLDMMMPKMSGDEVFEKLKEINPNVKVIICSGYVSDERVDKVLGGGGLGYLKKPFSIDDLSEKLDEILLGEG